MEVMEEGIVPQSGAVHAVFKGKRTKRQRQLQAAPATSSVSSAESSGSTTEEEADMANCLILLAQGRALDPGPNPEAALEDAASAAVGCGGAGKFTGGRFAEVATATNSKVGTFVYECKTCSRSFPSFQALGGHRASHKKLKIATSAAEAVAEEDGLHLSMNSLTKPSTVPAGKPRIHECSICGAEFASGQALGGHMRRHRPASIPEAQGTKERSLLSLDLNLPAPSEDDRRDFEMTSAPVFPFPANPKPLLFSASALVGCHY